MTPIQRVLSLSLSAPTEAQLDALSAEASAQDFTYGPVGATGEPSLPEGWYTDVETRVLGKGRDLWSRARDELFAWRQLDVRWLKSGRKKAPAPDTAVAFSARVFGLWLTQSCRVVFAETEESETEATTSFAWGTVGTHPLDGEERFIVRWNADTDEVVAEIRKFSKPAHPVVSAVAPFVRHLQRRFSRDALDALSRSLS